MDGFTNRRKLCRSRTYLRYDSGELTMQVKLFYLSAVRLRARAWDFDAVQGYGEHFNKVGWAFATERN